MIETSSVECFLVIVEQESFTRAARKLGIAQSAVSQKLRRLEDQLGICLIERTSRSLKLSGDGVRFMPFARQMIAAEERARQAAKEIAGGAAHTLRLGSHAFLLDERIALVEHLLTRRSAMQFEVHHGTRDEMLARLGRAEIDAFLSVSFAGFQEEGYENILLKRMHGHVRLPPGHRLSARESIALSELSGERFAVSPGREDANTLNWVCDLLSREGILLVPAPEAHRRSIMLFARMNDIPHLQWYNRPMQRMMVDGDVVMPIRDSSLFTDLHIYLNPANRRPIVERFRAIMAETAPGDFAGDVNGAVEPVRAAQVHLPVGGVAG